MVAGEDMRGKKVFVLEDEPIARRLLTEAVAEGTSFDLFGEAGSLAEARLYLEKHGAPDVLLADLYLSDGNGIEFIRTVKREYPGVEILVVSSAGDEENVLGAIAAGAGGYIYKDEPLAEIATHLESILRGESPISPSIAKHILKHMHASSGKAVEVRQVETVVNETVLTVREQDILQVLARGYSRKEAATHLQISPHTVTNHVRSIYSKLAVHSRTEAIFEACQLGLIHIRE